MIERNFSERENFQPLIYIDTESGVTYRSPFDVVVFGRGDAILGIGRVIGLIDAYPVVEVVDTSGKVEFLASECGWSIEQEEIETVRELFNQEPHRQYPAEAYARVIEAGAN
jgi:hypothetical protein